MNKNIKLKKVSSKIIFLISAAALFLVNLLINAPVLAHHPGGGSIPNTLLTGFTSGLGHPVIGIDHLAFVIAIGLLAALSKRLGMVIPLAFIVATAIGTGIHLQSINLPIPELIIAASVLVAGIFLVQKKTTNLILLTAISSIAGIFHGYAYGESIVGAQATVLGAYLLGFCSIQLAISAIAFYLGKSISSRRGRRSLASPALARQGTSDQFVRLAGYLVSGIGCAFLGTAILG